MTDAEQRLWRILREGFGDWHFRKQVPLRYFSADFASHRARLVIEVDGGQHGAEVDAERSAIIEEEGYRVLRFWNNEVIGNPDGVWSVIDRMLHERHPHPTSPIEGEES